MPPASKRGGERESVCVMVSRGQAALPQKERGRMASLCHRMLRPVPSSSKSRRTPPCLLLPPARYEYILAR